MPLESRSNVDLLEGLELLDELEQLAILEPLAILGWLELLAVRPDAAWACPCGAPPRPVERHDACAPTQ